MYKPDTKITPKMGSKIETVLRYILNNFKNNISNYRNYTELAKAIEQETGTVVDNRIISSAILRFNEGLYIVDDKDVYTYGMIIFSFKEPNKQSDSNDQQELFDDTTFDVDKLVSKVKGAKIEGGWTKIDGNSVRFSTDSEIDTKESEKEIKKILTDEFWDVQYIHNDFSSNDRTGVVFISDIHIGAFVADLIKTPDYNIEVIKDKLIKASDHINNLEFEKVHVMSLGDLIHSYTGTNHKNTWKGLEIGMHGPNVVKVAVKIIHEFFLSRIKNLSKVSMIAGNHCRTTQSNEEETQGGVSNLVAFSLDLMGYNVEFDVKCLSENVDGIQYILLHGDQGISKRPTKDIIWDFGVQGVYNFVAEGHLHSRIQRLSTGARDKLQQIKDDSIDCRRQVMPSVFTGDEYSENNLWFSNSGFIISVNNGEGKPIVIDIPL